MQEYIKWHYILFNQFLSYAFQEEAIDTLLAIHSYCKKVVGKINFFQSGRCSGIAMYNI